MSMSYDIQPIGRFVGQSAAIKRPKEIACFSYDDTHQFLLDDSSIRYYYPPTLGADLSKGFETFEKQDDTPDDHLDSLLKAIIAHEENLGKRVETDFFTWRGMMTKFMTAIFSDRDGFEMNATLFQDTIFIEENHEYKLRSHARQSQQVSEPGRPSQDMMSFWGEWSLFMQRESAVLQKPIILVDTDNEPHSSFIQHRFMRNILTDQGYKFETLCLLPSPWNDTSREYIENRENEIVSNSAQYCSVVRTGIGSSVMILGGEIDAGDCPNPIHCTIPEPLIHIHLHLRMTVPVSLLTHPPQVWDAKPADDTPVNWVELKTSADIRNDRDMMNFERKLMKFWIQSFLLGVPKIIVGFRTQDGILKRVEEMDTASIPSTVKRRGKGTWDGNMCINFAAGLLEFLKTEIKGDGVWRIRRKERSSTIEVFRIEEIGHGDIISDEFINWRIKLAINEK